MTVTGVLRRLGSEIGELLERHDRARDLSEFKAYERDPARFIREVLRGDPWSRQLEIVEAVRDTPLVTVRSANACGKDWCAARLALWWVYAKRGLVLLTGPTERQVREVVMGEVARAFTAAEDLPGELYQMALRLGREERAGILAFTSTEASRLTGFHAPCVMAVITEAQGVEEWAYEGILACTTGSEDRVLAVGNPLSPSGRFYTSSRPHSRWKAIQISALEHPNFIENRDVIPGGPSRRFVARIADEYGRGSGTYRARVLGEFPEELDEGLIKRVWLESAVEKFEHETFKDEAAEAEPTVAIDPARYGPDSTIVAVRLGPVLEPLIGWRNASSMETCSKIVEILEELGVEARDPTQSVRRNRWSRGTVIVDDVGVGGGVTDRLRELRYNVRAFNGGRAASNKRRFLNQRAAAYWELRQLLEEGSIALPRDEKLFDELLATRWRPNSEGKVQIEAKDDLKARLGRSPDRADAVVMAFGWRPRTRRPAIVV